MNQPPQPPAPYDPVAYWNDTAGTKWAEFQHQLDQTMEPLGLAAIDRAQPVAGEHVVDLGCGTGATSLELAARVAPGGSVLGLDISRPMLEVARTRSAGHPNLQFLEADASSWQPERPVDLLYSRFGVMFFPDPPQAFAHLHRVLPGARLAFACWREQRLNAWMHAPILASEGLLQLPPVVPRAPGPYAFAERDYVRDLLQDAGWRSVEVESHESQLTLAGGELEEAVRFATKIGPAAAPLAGADTAIRGQVRDRLREILGSYLVDGLVKLPAAIWIVTARA